MSQACQPPRVSCRSLLVVAFALACALLPSTQAWTASLPIICPARTYVAPDPDVLGSVWQGRKRYRLVVGAGEFPLSPDANRDFVEPTARMVDDALDAAGYSESLGLLLGARATRQNLRAALTRIGSLDPDAIVLVYYVGHGIPTDDEDDIALAVSDEPVEQGYGLRVRDLLARALKPIDPAFRKFPRITLILETCYSGAASPFKDGLRAILERASSINVKRLAFLTATSESQQARSLGQLGVAAFGYYLAHALTDEWPCADITPDGALTILELRTYLEKRLKEALKDGELDGEMVPDHLDPGSYTMLAYSQSRVADLDGYRDKIADIYAIEVFARAADATVTVKNASGQTMRECVGSCTVYTDSPESAFVDVLQPGLTIRRASVNEGDRVWVSDVRDKRGEYLTFASIRTTGIKAQVAAKKE